MKLFLLGLMLSFSALAADKTAIVYLEFYYDNGHLQVYETNDSSTNVTYIAPASDITVYDRNNKKITVSEINNAGRRGKLRVWYREDGHKYVKTIQLLDYSTPY